MALAQNLYSVLVDSSTTTPQTPTAAATARKSKQQRRRNAITVAIPSQSVSNLPFVGSKRTRNNAKPKAKAPKATASKATAPKDTAHKARAPAQKVSTKPVEKPKKPIPTTKPVVVQPFFKGVVRTTPLVDDPFYPKPAADSPFKK